MSMQSATALVEGGCKCGSQLSPERCCSFDERFFASPGERERAATLAQAAQRSWMEGRAADAEVQAMRALALAPRLADTRSLLATIRLRQGEIEAAVALFNRSLVDDPNQLAPSQEIALLLFQRGDLQRAVQFARAAVRLGPSDAQSHNLLAMILTEMHQPQAGEYHYRRVLELLDAPNGIVLANLAWNLKNQGRIEEARGYYRQSVELQPLERQTLMGWAKMEEADRNFDAATDLLIQAEAIAPSDPTVRLFRAVTEGRKENYEGALGILDSLSGTESGLGVGELIEKGQLLDKMGRHDEAFESFDAAKQALRDGSGTAYQDADAEAMVTRLEAFFTADRAKLMPRAGLRKDLPQPLFIVGFPRSGTTMVEQTLTALPQVSAGDELPMIGELAWQSPQILQSPLAYPEALSDLWFGDRRGGLDTMRDLYFQGTQQRGVVKAETTWFTDKMPLNETHLGLIHLMFPNSPVIHLLRHPLDVVLSVYSNLLTHGFCCSYALDTAALHYVRVSRLVAHYRAALPLRYLPVRYEDIVVDQEREVRRLLDFVGLPFDPACLNFHENRRYARTASYAQVTEKLYDRSRYRYRSYLRQLAPVIPLLEPVITGLGYEI